MTTHSPTFLAADPAAAFTREVEARYGDRLTAAPDVAAPAPVAASAGPADPVSARLVKSLNLDTITAEQALGLASDPATGKALLRAVARLPFPGLLDAVLNNPALDSDDRLAFARTDDYATRDAVVTCPLSGARALRAVISISRRVSMDAVKAERSGDASAKAWGPKVHRKETALRARVAQHPHADADILERLSNDVMMDVLEAVADNRTTTTETLVTMLVAQRSRQEAHLDYWGEDVGPTKWAYVRRGAVIRATASALLARGVKVPY